MVRDTEVLVSDYSSILCQRDVRDGDVIISFSPSRWVLFVNLHGSPSIVRARCGLQRQSQRPLSRPRTLQPSSHLTRHRDQTTNAGYVDSLISRNAG